MDVISPAGDFLTLLLGLGALGIGLWKIYKRVDGWNESTEVSRAAATASANNNAKLEELVAVVTSLAADVSSVKDEVTSNGGTSMKDRIEDLAEQVTAHSRHGDERHRVIDERIAAVEASLGALHRQLTRHDPSAE